MKYPLYNILITLLLLLCQCCSDDNSNNVTPVNQLPAATQEGKNTFGCLVDGQVFLPSYNPLAGIGLKCAYQYIDYPGTKGYFFQLSAPNQSYDNGGLGIVKGIGIGTDSLPVKEGDIIPLRRWRTGNGFGMYDLIVNNQVIYYTNDTIVGELHLTRFDLDKLIASGTFWFNAIDTVSGKTVKVTDGRFDVLFSL